MIGFLIKTFLTASYDYVNPIEKRRASALFYLLLAGLTLSLLTSIIVIIPAVIDRGVVEIGDLIAIVAPSLVALISIHFVQIGRLRFVIVAMLAVMLAVTTSLLLDRGVNDPVFVIAILPIVASGMLLRRRWFGVTFIIVMLIVLMVTFSEYDSLEPLLEENLVFPMLTLFLIFALFSLLGSNIDRIVTRNLEDIDRFKMVGYFAARVNRTDQYGIYGDAINLIRNQLGYDFAQVFLAEEEGRLSRRLRAGLNVQGESTISEVSVGDASALVEAMRTSQLVLVSVADSGLRHSHFLSATKFGVAIPIVTGDRVIAVLDVQNSMSLFDDTDVTLLIMLGETVASLIVSENTISSLREIATNQENTVEDMRIQLHKLKQLEQQIVGSSWDAYLERRGHEAIGFDIIGESGVITAAYDMPEELHQTLASGEVHFETTDSGTVVTLPINLQDEILGAIAFSVPVEKVITDKELAVAQSVTARLAIALENRRLFERSQSQALRERKANEVVQLLMSATDVGSVLSLAADSFNEALGAVSTQIHLKPDAVLSPNEPIDSDGR
jgi:GAF domain-containing protein